MPVHSFRTLLADLATIAMSTVEFKRTSNDPVKFEKDTNPTPIKQRTLDLLIVKVVV